jgi:hypothetical protein
VTTHVTTAIVEQLPVPGVDRLGGSARLLIAEWERLRHGHDTAAFARLNAIVARLYQLREPELERVLETFPLVERRDLDDVLRRFRAGG